MSLFSFFINFDNTISIIVPTIIPINTFRPKIFKINVDEGYTMQRYAEGKDESKILHNKKEINIAQCQIESDTFHDFYTCLSDPNSLVISLSNY